MTANPDEKQTKSARDNNVTDATARPVEKTAEYAWENEVIDSNGVKRVAEYPLEKVAEYTETPITGAVDYTAQCRKVIENLTIMDDAFMRNVLKEPKCAEHILRVIMNSPELKSADVTIQKDYKNLQGRSAVLDCVVEDRDGKQFNLEIQNENEGASEKRARYHSGLLDMNTLKAGEDYSKLTKSYVIFITQGDPLGYKLPIYHIRRTIDEVNAGFNDETYIIYVNGTNRDDTELGHLMHDLNCKNAADMYSPILAARVRELKETEEGVQHMCKELEELIKSGEMRGIAIGEERGIAIGETRGIALGEQKKQKSIATKLLQMGIPMEQIAEAVEANVATVRIWLDENRNRIN